MSRTTPRPLNSPTILTLAVSALLTMASVMFGASAAQAQAYRYWSLWNAENGAWVMSQTGPEQVKMVDKTVTGWRFAISPETGGPGPRVAPDFAALCPGAAEPAAGKVRVAVVADSGFTADAPEGDTPFGLKVSCIEVGEGTNGYTAIAAAGPVHQENGLVCGIGGYPSKECGAPVTDEVAKTAAAAASAEPSPVFSPSAAPSPAAQPDVAPWEPYGVPIAAVLAGALVVGLLVVRRRRSAPVAAAPTQQPENAREL